MLCLAGQIIPPPIPPGEEPPAPPPPPTRGEIIQIIAEIGLPAPVVGSAPCTDPGCMGAVGVPVWLWTQPWETVTDSVTIRGYTLTLSATPTRVDWSMGDGSVVTCTTSGTPYDLAYGIVASPDCGYSYQVTSANQPGQAYPLSATMTYHVTWSGVVTGEVEHSPPATTTQVRIGEVQTVIEHYDTP